MPAILSMTAIPVATGYPVRKLWTRPECDLMKSAGLAEIDHYELIDGELVQKVSKNSPHMRAQMLLMGVLRVVFGGERILQEPTIDAAPADTPTSRPEPDLIVLNRSFLDLTARDATARIRPEDMVLVAEISDSSLAFDLKTKAALYARAGIPEYWVLDLNGRRLIVHREPEAGQYRSVAAYAENESLSPAAAPAAEIPVAGMF